MNWGRLDITKYALIMHRKVDGNERDKNFAQVRKFIKPRQNLKDPKSKVKDSIGKSLKHWNSLNWHFELI